MERNLFYEKLPVRINTDNSEQTWFVGIDVCKILGYADPHQKIKSLDEDEYKLDRIRDGQGKQKDTLTVNESGLYSLILTSTKPEAKAFRKWVTNEVLPAIRKAGKFTNEEEKEHEANIQVLIKEIDTIEKELQAKKIGISDLKKALSEKKAQLFKLLNRDKSQLSIPFPKTQQL